MTAYTPYTLAIGKSFMLREELERLAMAPLDRSLDGLESDIWRGVEARTTERRAYRRIVSMQLAILTLSALGSVAVGHQWATTHDPTGVRGVFSPYARLAASHLLVSVPR